MHLAFSFIISLSREVMVLKKTGRLQLRYTYGREQSPLSHDYLGLIVPHLMEGPI